MLACAAGKVTFSSSFAREIVIMGALNNSSTRRRTAEDWEIACMRSRYCFHRSIKERAEVEQWLGQAAALAEKQRDHEPADSPVAILERMDCLKLVMRKRKLYQQGNIARIIQERLEIPKV